MESKKNVTTPYTCLSDDKDSCSEEEKRYCSTSSEVLYIGHGRDTSLSTVLCLYWDLNGMVNGQVNKRSEYTCATGSEVSYAANEIIDGA